MSVLFSITTCLHLPGKKEQTFQCLQSLFSKEPALHSVYRQILINEYTPNDISSTIQQLKELYPTIQIILKTADQKGQAKSINMIFDILKEDNPKYWLHWEESWTTMVPFLEDAIHVLEKNKDIKQLQIARGWEGLCDEGEYYGRINKEYVTRVRNSLGTEPIQHGKWKKHPWPMYSLQPGLDVVDFVIKVGAFDQKFNRIPEGKVDGSEFQFSHRWFCLGGVKAVLFPFRVVRQQGHVSSKVLLRSM